MVDHVLWGQWVKRYFVLRNILLQVQGPWASENIKASLGTQGTSGKDVGTKCSHDAREQESRHKVSSSHPSNPLGTGAYPLKRTGPPLRGLVALCHLCGAFGLGQKSSCPPPSHSTTSCLQLPSFFWSCQRSISSASSLYFPLEEPLAQGPVRPLIGQPSDWVRLVPCGGLMEVGKWLRWLLSWVALGRCLSAPGHENWDWMITQVPPALREQGRFLRWLGNARDLWKGKQLL